MHAKHGHASAAECSENVGADAVRSGMQCALTARLVRSADTVRVNRWCLWVCVPVVLPIADCGDNVKSSSGCAPACLAAGDM